MSKLHLAFKNYRPELLEATEALFSAKPWAMTDDEGYTASVATCPDCRGSGYLLSDSADNDGEECPRCEGQGEFTTVAVEGTHSKIEKQLSAGQAWLDTACAVYAVPPVKLVYESWLNATRYDPMPDNERHPAQIRMGTFKIVALFAAFAEHRGDNSMARAGRNTTGWAYSLYYQVRPRMFRKLVRQNRIPGVKVSDLYRPETWARIQAHGVDPSRPDVLSILARIDAGEQLVGSTEILGADDEAAALADLGAEDHMDRLRALASSDEDEDEDAWEAAVESMGDEPIEPADELVEEPEDEPVSENPTREALEALNRDEVRRIARGRGILNPSSKTKPELIELLLASVSA